MEWLHQGCDSDLSADFLNVGAGDFPLKNPFKKRFKIVCFFALAPGSGFGAAISVVIMYQKASPLSLCTLKVRSWLVLVSICLLEINPRFPFFGFISQGLAWLALAFSKA